MNYDIFHKDTSAQKRIVEDNNFTYRLLLEELNKYVRPKDRILDIGCGAGALSLYYANKGHDVFGIDISEKAIGKAGESAKLLKLKNVSFQVMEFPNENPKGKFDFIIFTEVIEHIKNDDQVIKKIYELLNSKGRVFISTPSIDAPLHKIGYANGFDNKVGHLRRYTEKDLINLFEKYDFEILKTKRIEGIVRNFMFLNSLAGNGVRILNKFSLMSNIFTSLDNISLKFFGNSNIMVVAEKK